MTGRMDDLAKLAGMVRDRELAKVETIMSQVTRLRGDIARLTESREARVASGELDLARVSGAELAWQAASEAELMRLNRQLAALLAQHDAALRAARRAFGRADVAARLAKADR
ncbi:hypothetical protein SAMN04488020_105120 [Palleronia marisminoris]|uniref:Uncharacterized protein n=2 Tax=Palleronia marisminoris TaxID=315423 RepID=A0A1Y5SSL4_9RHOB|nr:hypothetical protein SAMN04488020_105120 [Palleronia marisminoris]SLN47077.1 hypothetical protein PAM7066_02065 [Palleronia marisminoris]